MSKAAGDTAWTFETAEGAGGIAVLSIAGTGAFELLTRAFRPAREGNARLEAGRLLYGFIERDGEVLDEVVVAPFPEGNVLYQGPCAEVNCHGGVVSSREVGRYLTELGATALDHDAFMDRHCALAPHQRHALWMLTRAGTKQAMRAALEAFGGAGEERLSAIRALAGAGRGAADAGLDLVRRTIREAERAEALFRPRRLAVVGPTNVGKSSLVNGLVGEERVLVDSAPGTTRDAVEVSMALAGWPVTVFDTAGIREAGDEVEREGVERALEAARDADVVVVVLDARSGDLSALERVKEVTRAPVVLALNKADLLEGGEPPSVVSGEAAVLTCALTGQGVGALGAVVLEKARLTGGGDVGALLLEAGALEELRRMEGALVGGLAREGSGASQAG